MPAGTVCLHRDFGTLSCHPGTTQGSSRDFFLLSPCSERVLSIFSFNEFTFLHLWSRVEERRGRFQSVFWLREGLLGISVVFQARRVAGGSGELRQLRIAQITVPWQARTAGMASARLGLGLLAMGALWGHFVVRGAGDCAVKPSDKLGVQRSDNVTGQRDPKFG